MKKSFKLNGLECANCAQKMQDGISRLNGVNSASVNYVTTKLTIDCDGEQFDSIVEEARKIIRRLEPHVELSRI